MKKFIHIVLVTQHGVDSSGFTCELEYEDDPMVVVDAFCAAKKLRKITSFTFVDGMATLGPRFVERTGENWYRFYINSYHGWSPKYDTYQKMVQSNGRFAPEAREFKECNFVRCDFVTVRGEKAEFRCELEYTQNPEAVIHRFCRQNEVRIDSECIFTKRTGWNWYQYHINSCYGWSPKYKSYMDMVKSNNRFASESDGYVYPAFVPPPSMF
jgi:hypothetical protein